MRDLYPGYDVLAKRNTPSWNDMTRRVIDERLGIDPAAHSFFSDAEWTTLLALCDRIIPQPPERSRPVPIAALLDRKLSRGLHDGYRHAQLPPAQEAWKRGLFAIDREAAALHDVLFAKLAADQQDALLRQMQDGELDDAAWRDMPCALFFKARLLPDIVKTYYAHPTAWNEIGWGGPASPRGYVRLRADFRDPWEAAESKPGRAAQALRENRRVGR
ncbi:gluconate 2-dehydrogenase subunit 3 family protein [Bradyrhizobium sp. STM 3562]|uniref:gluconate 2-dehydrogenase subunit 3 family protein n=1 Tax=Bradyrhizobium sp. STM 3562 TaxID=578924 RepID=UPI00388F5D50